AFLPYNTREQLSRGRVASLLHLKTWDAEPKASGAIIHIEDSPFDLPDRLSAVAERAAANASEERRHEHSLPDHERDQLAIAERLWEGAGSHRQTLLRRANAARLYLESIETRLPAMENRENSGMFDAKGAWHERARRSAGLGTTFRALKPETAVNLLVHGYYLACVNLHVQLGWPLLGQLDADRVR